MTPSPESNPQATIGGEPVKADFARWEIEAFTVPTGPITETWEVGDSPITGELTGYASKGEGRAMTCQTIGKATRRKGIVSVRVQYELADPGHTRSGEGMLTYDDHLLHRRHRRIGRVLRRRKSRSRH